MAGATTIDPARGNALRSIAIASAAAYWIFGVVVAFGGTDASYQTTLWTSWFAVMLVAAGAFTIGTAMHRSANDSAVVASEAAPVLTSVV